MNDRLRARLTAELSELSFHVDHFTRRALPKFSADGLRSFDHFLSMRHAQLPGHAASLERLRSQAIWSRSTNKGYLAWTDATSEISALWILRQLSLEIRGLEQQSPSRIAPKKTCDIEAGYPESASLYFEVKHCGTEDAQWIPQDALDAFAALRYPATPQLVRYRVRHGQIFDCSIHLSPVLAAVDEHFATFERLKSLGHLTHQDVPNDIDTGVIALTFHAEESMRSADRRFISPVWAGDVEHWLFATTTRDGEPREPRVSAAIDKGAQFLVCEVGAFCPLHEIVEQCFDQFERRSSREFRVSGSRMSSLCGIILFRSCADWVLVENADASTHLVVA